MKVTGYILVAILAGGCTNPPERAVVSVQPSSSTELTKPSAPEIASHAASTTNQGGTKTLAKDPDHRTGWAPDRVNQLKDLKKVDVKVAGHTVHCWLMDNESKREEGMMFLVDKDVHDDEGMLFVFNSLQPDDGKHGFWMHNCPLGLDIAYLSATKKVISVANGKPFDDTSLSPGGDYKFVLEMKAGKGTAIGLKSGLSIVFPDTIKSVD